VDSLSEVDLAAVVAEITVEIDSLYKNTSKQRALLLQFMSVNNWFGADCTINGRSALINAEDVEKFRDRLTLWLAAFKQLGSVKIPLMLKYFESIYPKTCALFGNFVADKCVDSSPMYWHLLDFLLTELDRDITDCSESEIETLAQTANEMLSLKTAHLLSDFLCFAESGGKKLTQWLYTFEPREHPGLDKTAYALDDYAVMAYCIFNYEAWQRQDMVVKAIEKKTFANFWLFAALHLICALRVGDMERIPSPHLPYDADVVRSELLSGSFPAKCAAALCDEMAARISLKSMKPSKTWDRAKIPDIKLFVPESLRVPLGTIIAISLTHLSESSPEQCFVCPDDSLYNARTFFGEDFANAIGKRRFSSRRANKAYLQGIDLVANAEGMSGRPKGYILAALARSHKSGIATLPKATDVYLKDANFAGYTPEFIAREMFERGVFSFIPAILLEMYAGGKYKTLPVGIQTSLITELGLTAGQIERVANAVEVSLSRSKRVIAEFFCGGQGIRANIFRVLQNIASGNAPGKQSDFLCLMTAATRRCPHKDRSGCVGCGYEILTKSAMHSLMREYVRISALREGSSAIESDRYGKLLENAVLPAVAEFSASAQILYPDINTDILLDIVEEGMDYANRETREISERARTRDSLVTA
jgi:hypothetical protein